MTLADEDTKPILTDNANRAIQGNLAMQVTQPGGKICNHASSGVPTGGQNWKIALQFGTRWSNFEATQQETHKIGQIWN